MSGVVVVYQTPRSYWWPGATFGAQDAFSSIIALRSPGAVVASVICMARAPVWAWPVTPNVYAESPHPERSQHTGKPSVVTASRPPLAIRLTPAEAGRVGSAGTSSRASTRVMPRSRRLRRDSQGRGVMIAGSGRRPRPG